MSEEKIGFSIHREEKEIMKKRKIVTALLLVVTMMFSAVSVYAADELTDGAEAPAAPAEEYAPTAELASATWTGDGDIIINVKSAGEDPRAMICEMYAWSNGSSIGGVFVQNTEFTFDSEGNGTIAFRSADLKAGQLIGENGPENIDWTKIDQLEVSFSVSSGADSKFLRVYAPIAVKGSAPANTVTIKGDAGVTMAVPESAPAGLKLNVVASNGAEEKAAVGKVVKIAGDKIKTFDLSLTLDGEVYKYDGQFTSAVTLNVPEGWDLNNLALYYFNEETKEVTPVEFTVNKANGTVTFTTNHFSKYVLVQKEAAQNADSPKTGDQTNTVLYTSLLVMGAMGVAVLKRKKAL